MNKISAAIITYNEADKIAQCLQSLQGVVDEIIVVDSFSNDHTQEICQKFGCKVTERKFTGFGAQKQYALSLATYSYVLSIDADEVLDEDLRKSILQLKNEGFSHRIYKMNRLNFYCNKPVHHCGWYPDEPTRLFDKRYATWNLRDVDEAVVFPATLHPYPIEGQLLHYKRKSLEEHEHKESKFAALNASIMAQEGRLPGRFTPYWKAMMRFLKIYIFQLGFVDGTIGKEISKIAARSTFLTYSLARRRFIESRKSARDAS